MAGTKRAEAAAAMLVAEAMFRLGEGDAGAKLAGGRVASLSRRGASF